MTNKYPRKGRLFLNVRTDLAHLPYTNRTGKDVTLTDYTMMIVNRSIIGQHTRPSVDALTIENKNTDNWNELK